MATATSNSVSLPHVNGSNGTQTDEFINGLVQGGSWLFGNGPRVITYSFNLNFDMDAAGNFVPGSGGNWTSSFINAVNLALAAWSNVANISFANITSGTYFPESKADMALALTGSELLTSGGIVGLGFFPDPAFADEIRAAAGASFSDYPNPEGDVFFDNFAQYFREFFQPLVPGTLGFELILHEIGHALGLKHPDDDGSNGRPTFAQLGISAYDVRDWTVMNHFDVFASGLNSLNNIATPMPLDILAIQQIYGANTAFHAGNDFYTIRDISPTSRLLNAIPHTTIWDAGGIDTIISEDVRGGLAANLNPGGAIGTFGTAAVTYIAFGVTIENVIGTSYSDAITGNDAANFIDGGSGSDTLLGGAGDDTLRGGQGQDTLGGGAGTDTADYSDATRAFTVSLLTQLATYGEPFDDDTLTSIDNLIGTSFGDSLTGDANNNVLDGGPGIDTLTGGLGNDTFVIDNAGDSVVENSGAGTDMLQSWIPWTLPVNVENLTLLGSASYGAGNAANNIIAGNSASNPLLRGDAGADTIFGGGGNDWIEGDNNANASITGNDVLLGEDGDDIVFSGPGDDVVALGAGFDVAIGEGGNDAINGEGGNDAIDGGDGNDTLLGWDDQDILFGSVGNDTLFGGNGDDFMMGNRGDPVTPIDGVDLMFGDAGQDIIHGGAGDDGINGGDGNDVIDGSMGNDAIVGGRGADIMLGSGINAFNSMQFPNGTPGNDLFIYYNIDEAGDSVYGFDLRAGNQDRLFMEPLLNTFTNGATGTTLAQLNVSGHLRLLDTGPDVAIQVDPDGGGNIYTTLVTLVGVANTTDLNDGHFFLQM